MSTISGDINNIRLCQYKKLLNDDRVSSIGFMINNYQWVILYQNQQ